MGYLTSKARHREQPTFAGGVYTPRRGPAKRYVTWIDKHAALVLVISLAVAVAGGWIAARLHLQSDLTSLLPPSQPMREATVKAIQQRARPFGTVQVVVESGDAALTARAAERCATRLRTLPPDLVAQFSIDDGPRAATAGRIASCSPTSPISTAARDALAERIAQRPSSTRTRCSSISRTSRRRRDRPISSPSSRPSSPSSRTRATSAAAQSQGRHAAADLGADHVLGAPTRTHGRSAGQRRRARRQARRMPSCRARTFGLSGNVTIALHEHDSVLEGMTLSLGITLLLCGVGLVLYYRSGRLVARDAVGARASASRRRSRVAWALVGHLNVMTAFLFAIVVGNGINAGADPGRALPRGAARARRPRSPRWPHAIARRAAPARSPRPRPPRVAYASLLITDFRGFRQFGAIAGVGMALTWLTAFTVLPALLFVLARARLIKRDSTPAIGDVLAHALRAQPAAPAS